MYKLLAIVLMATGCHQHHHKRDTALAATAHTIATASSTVGAAVTIAVHTLNQEKDLN